MDRAREAELIAWLVNQARETDDLGVIVCGLADRWLAFGLPILRLSLSLPTIDPTSRALSFVWWRERGLSAERIPPEPGTEAVFRRSPMYYLLERNQGAERWNLEDPHVVSRFQLFEELRAEGSSEYALALVPFSERRTALEGVALSMATDREGGFADEEVAAVLRILPALALAAYRIGLLHVATETLAGYLGPLTGRNVLQGMVRRGDSRTISAALLLADLRGFTALADRTEPARVVAWLNEHLEAVGDPVAEHGGEVLKFLGDGLLAIFQTMDGNAPAACRNALSAANEALMRNAAVNAARAARGDAQLDLMLVLHYGEVVYGNVGTARRLDFTVIGKAVNEASRMEALGKRLGRPILLSEAFVRSWGGRCTSLGRHELRGVAGEREVFVPDQVRTGYLAT